MHKHSDGKIHVNAIHYIQPVVKDQVETKVSLPLNQKSGSAGCWEEIANGNAVSQKAHSAVVRPICQFVRVQHGQ